MQESPTKSRSQISRRLANQFLTKDTFINSDIQTDKVIKQQNEKMNKINLIRDDIFLIKVKVKTISIQNTLYQEDLKLQLQTKLQQVKLLENRKIEEKFLESKQLQKQFQGKQLQKKLLQNIQLEDQLSKSKLALFNVQTIQNQKYYGHKDNKIYVQSIVNYCKKKQSNGDIKLSIFQSDPQYLNYQQFKSKYPKQLKQQNDVLDKFQQFIKVPKSDGAPVIQGRNSSILQKLNLDINNDKQQNEIRLKKQKLKKPKKITKYKIRTQCKMKTHQTKKFISNKSFNDQYMYKQRYQFIYRRPLDKRYSDEQMIIPVQELIFNNLLTNPNQQQIQPISDDILQKVNKLTLTQTNINEHVITHLRPELQSLFTRDDFLMFSATENGLLQIKLKQIQTNSAKQFALQCIQNYVQKYMMQNKSINPLQYKQQIYNVFLAQLPLRKFTSIPYTYHQINLGLYHKIQTPQDQDILVKKNQRANVRMDLSIFCVPGVQISWGVLKIYETSINIRNLKTLSNTSRRYVRIKIQFPDIKQRNKYLISQQQEQIWMKSVTLDYQQTCIWTEDIDIKISPQKNKIKILFIEMQKNEVDIKQILAQKTVLLLQQGFLFDRVQTSKHIPLVSIESQDNESKYKIADLNIDYMFEMSQKKQLVPQKLTVSKSNAFVPHFGGLL